MISLGTQIQEAADNRRHVDLLWSELSTVFGLDLYPTGWHAKD